MESCFECKNDKDGNVYNFYNVKVVSDKMVTQIKKTKRGNVNNGNEKVVEIRKRFIEFAEDPKIENYKICSDCIKKNLKGEKVLSILFLSLTLFFALMMIIFTNEMASSSDLYLIIRIIAGFSLAISGIGFITRLSYFFRDKEGEKRDMLFSQILSNSQKDGEEDLSSIQLLSSIPSNIVGKTAFLREFEWFEYQERLKLSNREEK